MAAPLRRDATDVSLAWTVNIWKPFLYRACIAAVFGVITVFLQEPSARAAALLGGLYLISAGAGLGWTARVIPLPGFPGSLVGVAAAALVLGGVFSLATPVEAGLAWVGGSALVLAGLYEVGQGLRLRGTHAAGRDVMLAGLLAAGTGVGLILVGNLGAHALLGVAGGGALMTAVLLGLAGLGYRHDARAR